MPAACPNDIGTTLSEGDSWLEYEHRESDQVSYYGMVSFPLFHRSLLE